MNSPEETQVVVTDIQMPFFSMVVFMVKWALADDTGIFDTGAAYFSLFFLFFLNDGRK